MQLEIHDNTSATANEADGTSSSENIVAGPFFKPISSSVIVPRLRLPSVSFSMPDSIPRLWGGLQPRRSASTNSQPAHDKDMGTATHSHHAHFSLSSSDPAISESSRYPFLSARGVSRGASSCLLSPNQHQNKGKGGALQPHQGSLKTVSSSLRSIESQESMLSMRSFTKEDYGTPFGKALSLQTSMMQRVLVCVSTS